MNPAFSVILFTTLSGTGFGLWCWLALRIAFGDAADGFVAKAWMLGLIVGAVLVAAGVIASLRHLGRPERVWRAFSQWRSSWMSREGVLAILCFVPAAALVALLATSVEAPYSDPDAPFGGLPPDPVDPRIALALRIAALCLAPLSLATVYATAKIYASLATIPAWRHRLVVPGYLLCSALGGGLLFGPIAGDSLDAPNMIGAGVFLGAIALWRLKRGYWRAIDRDPLPLSRGDAVGLPGRDVSVFERPHTESNYLNREMGFVLARRHARRLRTIAVVLFALVPALCALPVWLLPHGDVSPLLWVAAASFQLGALVERWLFFAEAKHLVTLYY